MPESALPSIERIPIDQHQGFLMNGSTPTMTDPRTVGRRLRELGRETDSLYLGSSLTVSLFARRRDGSAARLLGGDSALRGLNCSSSMSTLNNSSHSH